MSLTRTVDHAGTSARGAPGTAHAHHVDPPAATTATQSCALTNAPSYESHGFNGFGAGGVLANTHDPIRVESEHDRVSGVHASAARLPAPMLMRHADDQISRVDQLLGHDLPVLKRTCELRDLSEHRLPPMQYAKQLRGVPLDL